MKIKVTHTVSDDPKSCHMGDTGGWYEACGYLKTRRTHTGAREPRCTLFGAWISREWQPVKCEECLRACAEQEAPQ